MSTFSAEGTTVVLFRAFVTSFENYISSDPIVGKYFNTCLSLIFILSFILGAYYVITKIWSVTAWFWRHWCRPVLQSKTRMFDMYGDEVKNSYALVSGASDGIGLAMCQNLA